MTWLTRASWGGAILFVVALISVGAIFQYIEREEIRDGIVVFGVDVSGMTEEEARAAVMAETNARASQPLVLVDGERTWEVTQREVGLRFDVSTAVSEAFDEGRSGYGPDRLAVLWHLKNDPTAFGTGHIAVDTDSTQSVLLDLSNDIYLPTIQPDFWIEDDGSYGYTSAQTGRELDVDASREQIVQALASGNERLDLTITEYPPAAENSDYEAVLAQAELALDAPLTLLAADQTWTFTPGQIASRLIFVPPSQTQPAALQLDGQWAIRLIDEIGWSIDRSPQSPRVWWGGNGQLIVTREPQPGYQIDGGAALDMVHDAFAGHLPDDTVTLPVQTILPPALPENLNSLGLTGIIAQSSTPYGGSVAPKKHNIELAAQLLNGTLIMPGQTFSFNSEIGPMTVDAGFEVAYGITSVDGELRTIPTEAGGICQVATTVFQPVFAGGYQIVQRSTHSYWIPSYAFNGIVGLDSTVDPASGLDLKWQNNSDSAILIQAETDGDTFSVRLIGQQPDWTVEIKPPIITNIDWADTETIHYQADTTIPVGQTITVEHAHEGFDVQVVRVVTHPDGQQTFWDGKMSYDKSRNVIAVGSENGELPPGY